MMDATQLRLRALAIGIRPSFGVVCGVETFGTVDLLHAAGINGWRAGIRLLIDDVAETSPLRAWGLAELEADKRRWGFLAAFVDTLGISADADALDLDDDMLVAAFCRGWRRNLFHAGHLLTTADLVVSPGAVDGLDYLGETLPEPILGGVGPSVRRLYKAALPQVDRAADDPPPLVLPDHLDALVAALGFDDDEDDEAELL
jgi:hypothetical protein